MSVEWILSSGGLILLVLLIRFFCRKKMPPRLRYALWMVVALRLLLPVSISETAVSILNLLPDRNVSGEGQESRTGQIFYEKNKEAEPAKSESGAAADMTLHFEPEGTAGGKKVTAENPGEKMDAGGMIRLFWLVGAGVCGGIFLAVNLDYGRRLNRSRRRIPPESLPVMSEIPVYETQTVQTPCLFGLFCPAVYVMEEIRNEEETFSFVLYHENTHYRQHDPLWALVRILCCCVHWFNPLVWLAARLSKQDGELACDERTLNMLGEGARVHYGKALLELGAQQVSGFNGWRISTTMSGSARQMKERLRMIVNAPGRTAGIRIFTLILVALLAVVTFTGKSSAKEKEDPQTLESLITEPQAEALKADEPEESLPKSDGGTEGEPDRLPEEEEPGGESVLRVDLNFDGWEDLCYRVQNPFDADAPYDCMLWNPESGQYEYSATLYNVEVDDAERWIAERVMDSDQQKATIYYRYDENNQLHMVKYVEEDTSPDAVFAHLELTYVEDGVYILPAVVDGTELHRTLISMAWQSLEELYEWTGKRVDTACFQITNMGDVYFGLTPEDIRHSRIFYSRAFGADTIYNLSNYEKNISSMYVLSGRSVWYSPVLWRIFPDRMEEKTDEEIITWYLERMPLVKDCKVKSIEKRYEDTWTVQTQDGVWFEAVYDVKLREISMVSGPYPEYPQH